jgi:hypothetical protein
MTFELLATYGDAKALIGKAGILPLSGFIPEYSSMESLTAKHQWHTGDADTDPWLWRDRLAGDGIAAYGRFFGKKPVLISRELFPLMKAAIGTDRHDAPSWRSDSAAGLYSIIRDNDAIDVKMLRLFSGMKDKDMKAAFDRALIELQSTFDVVISGITERLNAQGTKNGWNSTCYMDAGRWMELHHIAACTLEKAEAQERFMAHIDETFNEAAAAGLYKLLGLKPNRSRSA